MAKEHEDSHLAEAQRILEELKADVARNAVLAEGERATAYN